MSAPERSPVAAGVKVTVIVHWLLGGHISAAVVRLREILLQYELLKPDAWIPMCVFKVQSYLGWST